MQRFRGGFAVVWLDERTGKRRRVALVAADRTGAEAEARRRWQLGAKSGGTLGELVPAYIAAREADGVASAQRMRDGWKRLAPTFARTPALAVDEQAARAYAAGRKASPATVRYELSLISQARRWAARQGLIESAPPMWLPALPARRERHIGRPEFERLLEAAIAPHFKLYLELAIGTGARPSAILSLTWCQVDFDGGLIRLNPDGRVQTAKHRPTVPMTNRLRGALEGAWQGRQSDYVVEVGGRQIASVKKAMAAAAARAGLEVVPYTLRHSAAVWMAEAGVPMAEIAAYLGHADSRTTERHYAKFSPSYLRKAAAALDW